MLERQEPVRDPNSFPQKPHGRPQLSGDEGPLPDARLIADYLANRSPELFERIFARHGAMVYRIGCRLTANRQDAEDVVQAVFALLAQRPQLVRHSLGGWLHETARTKALDLRRSHARRARREEAVAKMHGNEMLYDDEGLREELDAALVRLNPAVREAVVLRYLEGRSQEESASIAGCPRGTLSRRASVGLEQLRTLLERRGVVVAPSLLLTFMGNEAVQQLPTAVGAAFSFHAVTGTAAGSGKRALGAFWVKALVVATGLAAAVGVVIAGVVLWRLARPPARAAIVQGPLSTPFVPAGGIDMGAPRETNSFIRIPKVPGSHSLEQDILTVRSSGLDVWATVDSCHFVYQTLDGDGEITARIASGQKTGDYPKAGVMLRQSLAADAANAFIGFNWGNNTLPFQIRPAAGVDTFCPGGIDATLPYWVKLVRRGGLVRGLHSKDGSTYHEISSQTLDLNRTVYVGLAVTSHNDGVLNSSTFDHVTITAEP